MLGTHRSLRICCTDAQGDSCTYTTTRAVKETQHSNIRRCWIMGTSNSETVKSRYTILSQSQRHASSVTETPHTELLWPRNAESLKTVFFTKKNWKRVIFYEVVKSVEKPNEYANRLAHFSHRYVPKGHDPCRGPTPEWVGWTVTGPSPAEGHFPWPGVLLVGELARFC